MNNPFKYPEAYADGLNTASLLVYNSLYGYDCNSTVELPRQATYTWNLLIAIDQWFNAFFGGNPYETMSSRMGRKLVERKKGCCNWRYHMCKFLSWIDPRPGDHCEESIGE